jgi:hypothetical protein
MPCDRDEIQVRCTQPLSSASAAGGRLGRASGHALLPALQKEEDVELDAELMDAVRRWVGDQDEDEDGHPPRSIKVVADMSSWDDVANARVTRRVEFTGRSEATTSD